MVGAALGFGLVIMALEVSLNKEKDPARASRTRALVEAARELLTKLKSHADEDIDAFERYLETLRLPKEGDEQKASRQKSISDAMEQATRAPLNAADDTLAGLEIAVAAVELTAKNVISDLGAGAAMMEAGVRGVLLNVTINLPHLSDQSLIEEFSARKKELERLATERAAVVSEAVEDLLAAM
jgi:formiminotetrahydrofolate cyclodeaminase